VLKLCVCVCVCVCAGVCNETVDHGSISISVSAVHIYMCVCVRLCAGVCVCKRKSQRQREW